MYPTLSVGPLSLPTSPILSICALWLGLDVMSRYGRRLGLDPDIVWDVGLVALTAGLVVAQLWYVVQFWDIYITEPLLIASLRPSGFVLWPGLFAALIAGYAYMIRKALDPVRIAAALVVGCVTAGIVLNLAAFLTGAIFGRMVDLASTVGTYLPSVLFHYGEPRHPVELYQVFGLAIILIYAYPICKVRNRLLHPRIQRHFQFPTKHPLRLTNVGLTLLWIVLGQRFVADPPLSPVV